MEISAVQRILAVFPAKPMGPVQAMRPATAISGRAGDMRLLPDTVEISPEARARFQAAQNAQASRQT